jgi:hypothetical protein
MGARRATFLLILAAGAGLTAFFLWRYRPALAVISEISVPFAASIIVALAALASGWGALALVNRPSRESVESALDEAFLIGIGVFGTLIGLLAWISVAIVPAVTVVLAIGGIAFLWKTRARYTWPAAIRPEALLLAPAMLIGLITAIAPAVAPDELIYKLAVPHAYELHGRMVDLPLNSHSYFVMAQQLADLPALMLGGSTAAHLFHFAAYLACLAAIMRIARRLGTPSSVYVAIAIAYTPALMIVAGWAFSEWAVLGLLLISFERYQRWLDDARGSDFTTAFAALGAAASIKYTALPWILVFGAMFIIRERRRPRLFATAASITFAFGAFFYIRNAVWTGSPIAPFLLPDAPPVSNYRAVGLFGGWIDFFRGVDILDPRVSDEALGILLPLAMIGVLFANWRDRATRDLALIGLVQTAILLTMAPVTRNLINGLVPLAIVGGVAITAAAFAAGFLLRAAMAAILILSCAAHLILGFGAIGELLPYMTGRETPAAFLARTRPFAGAYSWINTSTRPDARILLIGETRAFYLQRQFVSAGNLDGPRLGNWLGQLTTPERMTNAFRDQGITHLLLHPRWYRVQSGAPPPDVLDRETLLEVSPQTDSVLRTVTAQHADLRYRDGEYLIFELKR